MFFKQCFTFVCSATILLNSGLSHASELSKASGKHTTAILELYTSEGCSSCPPAEQYLKQLSRDFSDSRHFIPLAFHVDYWDYIGWEDPYADPRYGKRQRNIAIRNKLSSLYTPQFVLYGRNFPAHKNIPEAISVVNKITPRANINVRVKLENDNVLNTDIAIQANDERAQSYANIFIAITEDSLSSNITDGENRGLRMKHNHVVRQLVGPIKSDGSKQFKLNQKIKIDKQWNIKNLSLVVFAKDSIDGSTHQSLRLALKTLNQEHE